MFQEEDKVLFSKHHNRMFMMDLRWENDGKPKPIVLFVHGFKGFKDWGPFNLIAEIFAKSGFCFAKVNLSHNGTTIQNQEDFEDLEAFGQNNFSIELDDLQLALDYLSTRKNLNWLSDEIYLIGHSRGGGLALVKTSEDSRVKKLATWAAVSDFFNLLGKEELHDWQHHGVRHIWNGRTKQDMPQYFQIYEDLLANKDRLDILKASEKIKTPTLIVHGTADETVSPDSAREIASRNHNSQLLFVENSGHTFEGKHPFREKELPGSLKLVVDNTISFFKKM
ncbi:MAG: pimeloyl-ACP methyl ester carboxylesterase [Flammeovirgaceae bacterium]|jgi:pimeloyl-ACP methyl ester carboxylesterase